MRLQFLLLQLTSATSATKSAWRRASDHFKSLTAFTTLCNDVKTSNTDEVQPSSCREVNYIEAYTMLAFCNWESDRDTHIIEIDSLQQPASAVFSNADQPQPNPRLTLSTHCRTSMCIRRNQAITSGSKSLLTSTPRLALLLFRKINICRPMTSEASSPWHKGTEKIAELVNRLVQLENIVGF